MGWRTTLLNALHGTLPRSLPGVPCDQGFFPRYGFTLLALNEFDYLLGAKQINGYFDELVDGWQSCKTREEAEALEQAELLGDHHYPLNIQENRKPELLQYVRFLKDVRKTYRNRYLGMMAASPAGISRECDSD
jgi:hypothetical protein